MAVVDHFFDSTKCYIGKENGTRTREDFRREGRENGLWLSVTWENWRYKEWMYRQENWAVMGLATREGGVMGKSGLVSEPDFVVKEEESWRNSSSASLAFLKLYLFIFWEDWWLLKCYSLPSEYAIPIHIVHTPFQMSSWACECKYLWLNIPITGK